MDRLRLKKHNNQLQFVNIIWILITFKKLTFMKQLEIGTLAIRYAMLIIKAVLSIFLRRENLF